MEKYGAFPEEWDALANAAGFTNLLPSVCRPGAAVSAGSSLKKAGKVPCIYNSRGAVVGIRGWTNKATTAQEIAAWRCVDDYGICVQGRAVQAIDVDIVDPATSQLVRQYLPAHLPIRYRENASKFLVAFILPSAGWEYQRIETPHGRIEFLATGHQFLAAGCHESGVRYQWENGAPSTFPLLSEEEFNRIWSSLAEAFQQTVKAGHKTRQQKTDAPGFEDSVAVFLRNTWGVLEEHDHQLFIECPWKENHSADTGIGQTAYLLPGARGFDKGRFKCLHAGCQVHSQTDFLSAIGFLQEGFVEQKTAPLIPFAVPSSAAPEYEGLRMVSDWSRDGKGKIRLTVFNTCMALRMQEIYHLEFRYNAFAQRVYRFRGGEGTPIKDNDVTEAQIILEGVEDGVKLAGVARDVVRHAINLVAVEKSYDPLKAYVTALQWDGVSRINSFLQRIFGIPVNNEQSNEYISAVNRYFWTALAGRALLPGAKCDMVPVIIGAPGALKTTKVHLVAPFPEWAGTIRLDDRESDIIRCSRGKCVLQIDELGGLAGKDSDKVNSWITRTTDEIRELYAEHTSVVARRWVAIGTANPKNFLDGSAGSRRWLPVTGAKTVPGSVDTLLLERDQLWAEAVVAYQIEGIAYAEADRLADAARGQHRMADPWENTLLPWLEAQSGPFTAQMAFVQGAGQDSRSTKPADMRRLTTLLRFLGYDNCVRAGNERLWWKA